MSKKTDAQCLVDLGFDPESGPDFEEVKRVYRRLAMKLHPDRNPSESSNREFQTISVSYAQLLKRSQEGRWDARWSEFGSSPGYRDRSNQYDNEYAKESSGRRRFAFDYIDRGSSAEIGAAFFRSYVKAAMSLIGKDDVQSGASDLADGFMRLFDHYKLSPAAVETMQYLFLRQTWIQEEPGLFGVLGLARQKAKGRIVTKSGWDVSDALSVGMTLFKPSFSQSVFCALDEIAREQSRPCSPDQLDFHREMSQFLKSSFDPVEDYEKKNAKLLDPDGDRPLFFEKLIDRRPELFGIYAKAGWFDFSNEVYQSRSVGVAERLWDSKVPWVDKAAVIWAKWGAKDCSRKIARLPADQAKAASEALENMFIEADACELVSESKRSSAMNKHVSGKKLFESISKLSDPTSKINKIKSWVEPAGARMAGKAFEAISTRDVAALRGALSDWRSSGGSVESLSKAGVPLGAFIAMVGRFAGDEAFAQSALGEVKNVMGLSALRQVDSSGQSAMDHSSAPKAKSTRMK